MMRTPYRSLGLLLTVLAACDRSPAGGHAPPAPRAPLRVAPATMPAATADGGGPAPATADAAPPSPPTGEPPETDAAVATDAPRLPNAARTPPRAPADAGPPRQVVQVPGLRITRLSNGEVEMVGTDIWGGAINTTYQDCTYYRNALPVVRRSLPPAQAAVLTRVCTGTTP